MDNKFFTFIKPGLDYIDSGKIYQKPFKLLYILMAILNLLISPFILYGAISNSIFDAPAKMIITFILVWIIATIVSWISFQIWWNRKETIDNNHQEDDEFFATPVFAHFTQTFGEWMGFMTAVLGFFVSLIVALVMGDSAGRSLPEPLSTFASDYIGLIIMPIYGFLIIVASRFFAEQIKAIATIANNTKKL